MKREASRVGMYVYTYEDTWWLYSFSNCVTRVREREACTRNISTSFRPKVTATFRFRFSFRAHARGRNDACRVPNRNCIGALFVYRRIIIQWPSFRVHKVTLRSREFITKADEETDKWKLLQNETCVLEFFFFGLV